MIFFFNQTLVANFLLLSVQVMVQYFDEAERSSSILFAAFVSLWTQQPSHENEDVMARNLRSNS